jgi:hypothetical protein
MVGSGMYRNVIPRLLSPGLTVSTITGARGLECPPSKLLTRIKLLKLLTFVIVNIKILLDLM